MRRKAAEMGKDRMSMTEINREIARKPRKGNVARGRKAWRAFKEGHETRE